MSKTIVFVIVNKDANLDLISLESGESASEGAIFFLRAPLSVELDLEVFQNEADAQQSIDEEISYWEKQDPSKISFWKNKKVVALEISLSVKK